MEEGRSDDASWNNRKGPHPSSSVVVVVAVGEGKEKEGATISYLRLSSNIISLGDYNHLCSTNVLLRLVKTIWPKNPLRGFETYNCDASM